jgi:hypothetical protein
MIRLGTIRQFSAIGLERLKPEEIRERDWAEADLEGRRPGRLRATGHDFLKIDIVESRGNLVKQIQSSSV